VEQKNYSVVRRAVGYRRHDTEEELEVLNALYDHLRLYTNFFQPVMKLVNKTRIGSKVKKKYDQATTPYKRTVESDFVPKQAKEVLKEEYASLNPVKLKRKIITLQEKLDDLVRSKSRLKQEEQHVNLEYIFT